MQSYKGKRKPAAAPGRRLKKIRLSASPEVSVVIPVMNEIGTLASVIREAARVHPETEVIVVANGSRDGSAELAASMGARVIRYKNPLGHDVGRSIGAKAANGKIVLFTDGDIVIPAAQLKPFVHAVADGVDVALNRYTGSVRKRRVHSAVLSKHALNILLGRPQLKGASLTAIPHALSRRAIESIGAGHLAIPPKAQAIAIQNGLRLEAVHFVDVGKNNPVRRRGLRKDPVESLIFGDHLEAIHFLTGTETSAAVLQGEVEG